MKFAAIRHWFARLVRLIFTSGYGDLVDKRLRGRIILFNTVLIIAVALLTPFGIIRLMQGSIVLGCINCITALFLAALSVYHWKVQQIVIPRIAAIALICMVIGFVTVSTGYNNTGLIWSFCLPTVIIFVLDRTRGSLLLLVYMLVISASFLLPVSPSHYNYSTDLKIVFLCSFVAVWIISYYFEYLMSSLQKETVQNNIALTKTITELNETKDQLFHAQKLEAIGRLAGGVAHDFNNILTAITGYAELIRDQYSTDAKLEKFSTAILNSTSRAADLTAKLLAYARKGKIAMTAFDMHQLIRDVIDICEHTMDKKIVISPDFRAPHATVMGDRNQLQNAIMNLALNARDSMPNGGKLLFTTEIIDLTGKLSYHSSYTVIPGRYLKLCISDTGTGMDQDTLSRAFEPFFTTKEKSKGTGLGLSSVYGIVKSHNGYIELKSAVGKGTHADMYLPLSKKTEQQTEEHPAIISIGHGTLLFVDDEDLIRDMASEMIRKLGYSVVTCCNGEEAVEYYKTHADKIDVVILDIIMPKMGGYACFNAMKAINPELKVIASSGYVINDEVKKMLDQGALGFIHKPFSFKILAEAINNAFHGIRQ
jgi:signal transduction histidine kinase/ActR/RegA family two-component response regulator